MSREKMGCLVHISRDDSMSTSLGVFVLIEKYHFHEFSN